MPVRAVYVPLSINEMEALKALGRREDRDLRRQAAKMLRESLHRAGALTNDTAKANGPLAPLEATHTGVTSQARPTMLAGEQKEEAHTPIACRLKGADLEGTLHDRT